MNVTIYCCIVYAIAAMNVDTYFVYMLCSLFMIMNSSLYIYSIICLKINFPTILNRILACFAQFVNKIHYATLPMMPYIHTRQDMKYYRSLNLSLIICSVLILPSWCLLWLGICHTLLVFAFDANKSAFWIRAFIQVSEYLRILLNKFSLKHMYK